MDLDPRINAFRPDLADARLEGKVASARFVAGTPSRVAAPSAPLKRAPAADAPLDSEVLCGEMFTVFDTRDGWSWGQLATDGYVGYVPAAALGPLGPLSPLGPLGLEPTHRIAVQRTFIYPGPDMKLPAAGALSIGGRLTLGAEATTRGTLYREIAGGGWIAAAAALPVEAPPERDFVAVAARFLHVPYLWGGRTSLGLDCSALVQVSLAAAGIASPRDTDQQERSLGEPLAGGIDAPLRRGDLIFWKGHVAILLDGETIVHASGHHLAVAVEPLSTAVARIARSGARPSSLRRL
jgi:cell wall-associated NlpC family hydrolase